MKYKLIIFDVDGTITEHISSWQYLHEKLGMWDTLACRYQEEFLAGKISYRKFCELDAAHWRGMNEEKMRKIFQTIPYSKNVIPSIRKLKELGFKLVALSTGLQYMMDRVIEELKFDYALSNRLIVRKGVLTGGVKININHDAKGEILQKVHKRFRVQPHELISVGDSAGDIPMAKYSGYSIAFNSSSSELSKIVDYNCKTKNFNEVFEKIISISNS